jgi:hypothetical protein
MMGTLTTSVVQPGTPERLSLAAKIEATTRVQAQAMLVFPLSAIVESSRPID